MPNEPIICFGQQPCGFLPRRFLFAKIQTALQLRDRIGGRIVFFYHDSDHDPRETQTILVEEKTGDEQRLNFRFTNKIQKKYSPLYVKKIAPDWQSTIAPQLPKYLDAPAIKAFKSITATNAADFCLDLYRALGLLDNIDIARSSDPQFREAACPIDDYFVDVLHENETVRARRNPDGSLQLHQGGDAFIDLPAQKWDKHQISPARDTRLRWMQSVLHCTHYVAGAGEMNYLDTTQAPEIEFLRRDEISDSSQAYLP